MSSSFQRYEFKELGAAAPAEDLPAGTQRYQEPQFQAARNAKAASEVHAKRDAFSLDHQVAGQLGLDERERLEQEARIKKEIDRRWEQTSEQAEAAGYTKGLEEGKAEAYKAEQPRIRERLERFEAVMREIDQFRDRIFAANEIFLTDIVAEVASMGVLKGVQIERDYVRRVITTLLHQLGGKDDVKILISETDYANLEAVRAAIDKEFGKLSNTTIEYSLDIPVGGCKLETRFGVVDASVAAQIENVKKAIKG